MVNGHRKDGKHSTEIGKSGDRTKMRLKGGLKILSQREIR